MRFARPILRQTVLVGLFWLVTGTSVPVQAGGVTIITHGLNGTTTGWVTGMANAISSRAGGNVPVYRLQVVVDSSGSGLTNNLVYVSGPSPLSTAHGEIIVLLDWSAVANGNSYDTYQVAAVVAPALTNASLIPDLDGHALAEFPLHLIGHSRGGSLVCELSRLLGTDGIWVDHLTGLDTHPLNNDGFTLDGFLYSNQDAPAHSYENVLWSESYYQNSSFPIYGELVPGSAWRRQTSFVDGYSGTGASHSDIHLWYHATIDLNTPSSDTEAAITSAMRSNWWTSVEQQGTNAGFVYTRLEGGDRLSSLQPSGSDSSPIRDGFNRYYDVGGGIGANNRTPVGSNSGEWPNPIRFDLLTTNLVAQGDTATLGIYFQWAQPTNDMQSVQVLADADLNPLDGNEILLKDGVASGTTVAKVAPGTIDVDFDGSLIPPGDYHLFVKMSAAGRTRYLYAPEAIELRTRTQPLRLDITSSTNSTVVLGINGNAGQTAVLEASVDGLPWLPVATNIMESSRWEIVAPLDPSATMTLFRAVVPSP